MKTLRYITRLVSTFVTRFRSLLILGIIVGAGIFFALTVIGPSLFGRTIDRIGVTGRYTVNELPDSIVSMVGEGLTRVTEDGLVEPAIAEKWETPDGGKTWIFTIKKDAKWQDGKAVTSEDINYQFSDVEVEKLGDNAVVFKLQDAFSPFPSVVSRPIFKSGLLSTGEWEVTKASVVGEFVQNLVLTNSQKDRIIYRFYPTEDRTRLAYQLGEVDTIQGLYSPEPFNDWNTATVQERVNTNQAVTLFFNTDSATFNDNKPLRQALDYAIDKKVFGAPRAISPIAPDSWAYNPQVKPYLYDLARAKELVGEGTEELEIRLVTTPVLLSVAEKIAQDWEALGIKTTLQVSSVIPTDYDAYLAILDIPRDPDQYSIWHSTQTVSNISNFRDARIDKLLEDGRLELNLEERKKIYLDFQRFLVEELPAAFLYHPITYTVTRS